MSIVCISSVRTLTRIVGNERHTVIVVKDGLLVADEKRVAVRRRMSATRQAAAAHKDVLTVRPGVRRRATGVDCSWWQSLVVLVFICLFKRLSQ